MIRFPFLADLVAHRALAEAFGVAGAGRRAPARQAAQDGDAEVRTRLAATIVAASTGRPVVPPMIGRTERTVVDPAASLLHVAFGEALRRWSGRPVRIE